eukprot:9453218-Prorocentrum_lima.AAC.1
MSERNTVSNCTGTPFGWRAWPTYPKRCWRCRALASTRLSLALAVWTPRALLSKTPLLRTYAASL